MGSRTHARCAGALLLAALGVVARPAASGDSRGAVEVTPVEGPSTLHHLKLTIERSSMGWGGQWSPPPSLVPPSQSRAENTDRRALVLSGADLYRISCRACHKPDGSGSPPEINSLIGPVQAASFQWMTQRMKAMGRPADPALRFQIAGVFLRRGEEAEGIAWLESVVRLVPSHAKARQMLVDLYERSGKPRQARAHRQALARLDRQPPR